MTARPSMGFVIDFDDEAGVWYVSDSIPSGVNTASENLDELFSKIAAMTADLLEWHREANVTIRLVPEHDG